MHGKNAEEAKGYGALLYPSTTSSPTHNTHELLPVLHCKFMVSAECKLSCFAYYPSTPGDSAIDHWFVQWFATGWIKQVKKDRAVFSSKPAINQCELVTNKEDKSKWISDLNFTDDQGFNLGFFDIIQPEQNLSDHAVPVQKCSSLALAWSAVFTYKTLIQLSNKIGFVVKG